LFACKQVFDRFFFEAFEIKFFFHVSKLLLTQFSEHSPAWLEKMPFRLNEINSNDFLLSTDALAVIHFVFNESHSQRPILSGFHVFSPPPALFFPEL
jgi:hypothetical protein